MESLLPIPVWAIAKGCMLFALGLYLVFALILVRQVYMMAQVICNSFNWLIKLFAWAHLLLSIFIFLLAFIIL